MNVEAAAQSFARHPRDQKVWRLTASELGSAWGRLSHEDVSRLALAVSKTESPDEPEWLSGARTMLLGVLEAILHARTAERVADQVRKQVLDEALALRPSWPPILRTLLRRPSRPSEIAAAEQKDESGVSKTLGEMETKGFVERIEARKSASSDARAVFFQLTPSGRTLAERCALRSSEKTIETREPFDSLFSVEPSRDSPSGAGERVGNVSGVSMKTSGKSVVLSKGDMKSMIGKSPTQRGGMSAAMHAVTLLRK